jgi:hypothetical protein
VRRDIALHGDIARSQRPHERMLDVGVECDVVDRTIEDPVAVNAVGWSATTTVRVCQ